MHFGIVFLMQHTWFIATAKQEGLKHWSATASAYFLSGASSTACTMTV
jgi:hypothetical protein